MGKTKWNLRLDNDRTPGTKIYPDGVHFGFYASTDAVPSVVLYEKGEEKIIADLPFPGPAAPGNFYSMKVDLPADQYEYNFKEGDKILTDPYARRIAGRDVYGKTPSLTENGLRGGFLSNSFNWGKEKFPNIPYEDIIMYHLHVRGFTQDEHSGVKEKGTFAGLKKKIPYLKSLGINQIRLMPIYEFSELNLPFDENFVPGTLQAAAVQALSAPNDQLLWKKNYWGYGSGFYFSPKSSYASSEHPDLELKELVKALHANGIEILMDICFDENADILMICNCLEFWVEEYHVDGFFLIGKESLAQEISKLPLFSERKLICSSFQSHTEENSASKRKCQTAVANDGFQNDCRHLLKGDPGFIEAFCYRLRNKPNECANINYLTNHDGFTLLDLVSYNMKYNEANEEGGQDGPDNNFSWNCGEEGPSKKRAINQLRMRQRKNAFSMLLLSQGTPMILAGDEFGNSQGGNNNPWCLDEPLTWLNWGRSSADRELLSFVKNLIAYRKKHRIFHQKKEPQCSDYLSIGCPDLSYHSERAWYPDYRQSTLHTGCMYNGNYSGEDIYFYIAWNFHWNEQNFALPLLEKGFSWFRVMDTSLKESFISDNQQEPLKDTHLFTVPGRTVVILEGRENGTNKRKK